MDRQELSYDGKGINGPDEHRSRVATFANDEAAKTYGELFAESPTLLAAAREFLGSPMLVGNHPYAVQAYCALSASVARATGKDGA
jgi:hypothetical protein